MIKLAAFGLLVGSGSGLVCQDGTTPGPVRLQFAQFLDTGAFKNDELRSNYREDVKIIPEMLANNFGPQTDYKLYYFNERNDIGVWGCGSETVQQGFIKASEYPRVVEAVNRELGPNNLGPRLGLYNTAADAIYYSLRHFKSGWLRSPYDENGLPVMRILSIASDVAAWRLDPENLKNWPRNLTQIMLDTCYMYNYPDEATRMHPTTSEFPDLGTYYFFLTHTDPDVSQTSSLSAWYKDVFMNSYLLHAKGEVQEIAADLHHANATIAFVERALCNFWAQRPQIADPPTGYTCDPPLLGGPIHIQFAEFVDTGAFQLEEHRRAHRLDVSKTALMLADVFGPRTEYKLYYYNEKNHRDSIWTCVAPAIGDGFLSTSEFYKIPQSIFEDIQITGWYEREYNYSSLADALYYSITSSTSGWDKNERDFDGIPILRIFSIATDVTAWTAGAKPELDAWPDNLDRFPPYDCFLVDYPDVVTQLQPAIASLPRDGTYFIIMAQTPDNYSAENKYPISPEPNRNISAWYKHFFLEYQLKHSNGFVEDLVGDQVATSERVVELVKKAACRVMASF